MIGSMSDGVEKAKERARSTCDLSARALARATEGQVAQLVEHTTENRSVGGSIPSLATNIDSLARIGGSLSSQLWRRPRCVAKSKPDCISSQPSRKPPRYLLSNSSQSFWPSSCLYH